MISPPNVPMTACMVNTLYVFCIIKHLSINHCVDILCYKSRYNNPVLFKCIDV